MLFGALLLPPPGLSVLLICGEWVEARFRYPARHPEALYAVGEGFLHGVKWPVDRQIVAPARRDDPLPGAALDSDMPDQIVGFWWIETHCHAHEMIRGHANRDFEFVEDSGVTKECIRME